MNSVYILLVNWNGWADTVECLESLLRLDFADFRIIVCDNGSSDASVERLRAWAAGTLDVLSAAAPLDVAPPSAKPLRFVEYDRSAAEAGGDASQPESLVLIQTGGNLGFAGGNNVALRYIMAKGDADYVWLLNNDTVVDPGALRSLVKCLEARPAAGICGSTVLDYWRPARVDALGGAYYCRWLGLAWHLGHWRPLPPRIDANKIEKRMDYVVGSSMCVSARMLREVGLLEESYFLYYEELDWATRCHGRFSLAYAPESIVYHKVGGTIGTSSNPARKSMVSDYYTLRNRLKFTREYCPIALPTVYLGLLAAVAVRLAFGQWRKALMVWRLLIDPRRSFEQCTATS